MKLQAMAAARETKSQAAQKEQQASKGSKGVKLSTPVIVGGAAAAGAVAIGAGAWYFGLLGAA